MGEDGAIHSWNGTQWQTHTGASLPLSGVYVVSATEAYAVGTDEGSYMFHWTGGSGLVAAPRPIM